MAENLPEGEFYSRLYVQSASPQKDSPKFRNRLAAYFEHQVDRGLAEAIAATIEMETGYIFKWRPIYKNHVVQFFKDAPLIDFLTGLTIIWRILSNNKYDRNAATGWIAFIARGLNEEALSYRVDNKCGIHPLVDREFEQGQVSVLACLMDSRYAAAKHAVEAAYQQLSTIPIDGKGAARNIFEAAESMSKTITGSNSDLSESFVNKQLRPICDRLFNDDPQLKATTSRLLSSFGKWVDAIHPYRHGHDRDQPLILPDDLSVLAVSQGAGFIRWLVAVDKRQNR
jgi:hypothetical protein